MSDDYVKVTARILFVMSKAFRVEWAIDGDINEAGVTAWIPFSCIHGGDEPKISTGSEVEFRLRAWKAKQIGIN